LFREAAAGDRLITMALLAPGWESDYEGRPPLYPMACLGRIAAHHRLPDGSYNLLLTGLKRVEIVRELPPLKSFREAEVAICEDVYPAVPVDAAQELRRRLHAAIAKVLPALVKTHGQVALLTEHGVPLGVLTDLVGYMLDIPLACKQALLAQRNVHRRVEMLLEHLARAAGDASPGAAGTLEFPPAFSEN
jgi:Lon protease-like protein